MRLIRLGCFSVLALTLLLGSIPARGQAVVVDTCGTLASPLPIGSTGQPLRMDETGNLCSSATGGSIGDVVVTPTSASGAATSRTTTTALAANLVVKGSAGNLYGFTVSADSTLSGAAWWIMVYDATSAPADGAVTPAKCYAMPSGVTSASYSFPAPTAFATGITIGVSTDGCFTKAASIHAFISGDYK